MASVGISLGNTRACVAVIKADGRPEVIANALGERTTPCVVGLLDDSELSVGLPAKQGMKRNSRRTMQHFVRLLGVGFSDAAKAAFAKSASTLCPVADEAGSGWVFALEAEKFKMSPAECTSKLLEQLKSTAQGQSPDPVTTAVVAVPVDFSDASIDALREAAAGAGLDVPMFVREPIAVALAYGVGQEDQGDSTFIVYDAGANEICATLVKSCGGLFEIVDYVRVSDIGGISFDSAVTSYLVKEFKKKHKVDLSNESKALHKLRPHAESAKEVLSSRPSATVSIDSLHEGLDFQCAVVRSRFDILNSGLYRKVTTTVSDLLSKVGLDKSAIDRVYMAGGTSMIPKVKATLAKLFERPDVVQDSLPADEVIALGSALQAGFCFDRDGQEAPESLPTTSAAIALKGSGDEVHTVIPRGCPVPIRRELEVALADAAQTSCLLALCEVAGDGTSTPVVDLSLSGLSGAAGALVKLSVEVTKDGNLKVTAIEAKADGGAVDGAKSVTALVQSS